MKIYTTCEGHTIPLDNIDYVSPICGTYHEGYTIYLKSGQQIGIYPTNGFKNPRECRAELLKALKEED